MKSILSFSMILMVFLTGCRKEQLDDCFSSTGKDKTIERMLSSFHRINIGDKFKVTLTQDTSSPERIQITGGKNILEGISTDVDDGTLIIKNCNTCNFVRSYDREVKLEIFLHNIDDLFVYGACSVKSDDTLHLQTLKIDHSALEDMNLILDIEQDIYIQSINSGGMTLKGNAKIFKCSIEEITDVVARDFVCEEVLIDTHTPLDCYVNATRLLFVKIFNSGNVYYTSEPSERKELNIQTGTGELLKAP